MLKEVVEISNQHGIHARPAGVLAKACAQYQSRIEMIYDGKSYITSAWWIATFAGLAIIFTVIVFYMMGDGLNHVLNPKHVSGGKK